MKRTCPSGSWRRALALLSAAALASCAPSATIRVGLLIPQTGSLSDTGTSCMEGARLAVNELNAPGGLRVGGKRCRLELIVGDCQDTPETAVSAALDLINKRDVLVIIGPPFSSQAIPVARLAERSGVPMITQLATNPEVTRGMHWVFRVCFTDQFQGYIMARFARTRLHARRAAMLYDKVNAFTRDISAIFRATFEAAGGRMVAEESYTTGQKDFDAALRRIKAAAPDVLFLPGLMPDLRIQLPRATEMGITATILGCDTMFFRDATGVRMTEGAYISAHFSPDVPSPRVTAFDEIYRAAYKRLPTPGGALTYDAFSLLAHVVGEEGSTDPARIRDGLTKLKGFEGVTGTMVFEGRADPIKSAVIVHADGGEFHYAAIIAP